MTNPNSMPKSNNRLSAQIVDGLISVSPSTWKRKTLTRDEDGKEKVDTVEVVHSVLRYPLAQNVSDLNVERIARKTL